MILLNKLIRQVNFYISFLISFFIILFLVVLFLSHASFLFPMVPTHVYVCTSNRLPGWNEVI